MSRHRLGDEPIFEELADGLSHLLRHRHYDHDQSNAAETATFAAITATPTTATEAPPMASIITEVHTAVTEGITNIEGWAEDLKGKLPELATLAAKYENSPIVQALETTVLPPAIEAEIAEGIKKLAVLFPPAAAATPPAETPAAPAEPAQPVAAS